MVLLVLLSSYLLVLASVGIQGCSAKCNGNNKPAFFATLRDIQNLSTNTVLKFTRVKTNIGYGYDSRNGKFKTPKAGVYEFNTSLITNGDNWLELNLMKNGEFIARSHSHKSHGSTGTLNVILKLRKGDEVYIQHPRGFGSIYGWDYSMFFGHML
ncbi:C1QL [Mytilus coruscus]|uniref:C1QL n=1 Tax=Mytilus coruscus TaxID=42192 RepID=A0A6J8B507_MYTCO|nr:C1QL [Mytilus coruscus]